MDKPVLELVQSLSLSDKKNLTQTALKAGEEFGELASFVVPYENGHATTHRFVVPRQILEESVDLVLCALSVAYKLGYTHDDIQQMMVDKCQKWDYLQSVSNEGQFPVPFEIHVTVSAEHVDSQRFKDACAILSVKPIILDLQYDEVMDWMTSSVIRTDNAGAYQEARRISEYLKSVGFVVLREKIESVPWHPMAPRRDIDDMPEGCYFESHFNVQMTAQNEDLIDDIVEHWSLHKSRNVFKTNKDGSWNQMLTLRSYTEPKSVFENHVSMIEMDLVETGFVVEKVIVEFSVYDTKIAHDANWISAL